MSKEVFLGVVERDGFVYIPWRGTHVQIEQDYEEGQNLLVTLELDTSGFGDVASIELPTLLQLKQIKDELSVDWDRFNSIFQQASMAQKVIMLRVLNEATIRQNWRVLQEVKPRK